MEMNKASLALIIHATRGSIKLAKATQALLHGRKAWTEADEIAGRLKDALFFLTEGMTVGGKVLSGEERMKEIEYKMENSTSSDEELAELFMIACKAPVQPAPHTFTRASFEETWKQAGGYLLKAVGNNDTQ